MRIVNAFGLDSIRNGLADSGVQAQQSGVAWAHGVVITTAHDPEGCEQLGYALELSSATISGIVFSAQTADAGTGTLPTLVNSTVLGSINTENLRGSLSLQFSFGSSPSELHLSVTGNWYLSSDS